MRELEFRTTRVRRGWLERLKGYERAYETKLTIVTIVLARRYKRHGGSVV